MDEYCIQMVVSSLIAKWSGSQTYSNSGHSNTELGLVHNLNSSVFCVSGIQISTVNAFKEYRTAAQIS